MRKKSCLWKSIYQKLSNGVGAAVVVLCGFVLAFPQAAWEDCVIAEVSVCCPATVDVDGTPLGGGAADIAGVKGCRVEKDCCAGGADKVLCGAKIVSLKRRSFCGLRRARQDAEGVRRVVYICQVKDDR